MSYNEFTFIAESNISERKHFDSTVCRTAGAESCLFIAEFPLSKPPEASLPWRPAVQMTDKCNRNASVDCS